MRPSFLTLVPLFLLALIVGLAGGCSSSNDAAPKQRCKPGQSYFCKCADLSDGEKLCKADGNSFEACMQGDTECPGGEAVIGEDGGVVDNDGGTTGPARETCPGEQVTVTPGTPVTLTGDTTLAPANNKGTAGKCVNAEAGENVFAIKPSADGKLRVEGQALHDITTYAREGDCATGRQLDCRDDTGAGARESFTLTVTAGKTYYVFVDGKAGQTGKYTLTLTLDVGPKCNDGIVQDGEACDDGDQLEDNGCNTSCLPAGDTSGLGRCDATGHGSVKVNVWNTPVTFTGSTTNMGQNFSTNANLVTCGGTGGPYADRAYAVIPHKSGQLTVTISNANFDHMLYARQGCGSTTDLACADANNDSSGESITFPVTAGTVYDVIIDGSFNSQVPTKGNFTMTLSIQ
jgi:cysteine-rich repeat protein